MAQTAQSAPALSDEQFIEQTLYPAVVLLYTQTENGDLRFICTATSYEKTPGGTLLGGDTYDFVTTAHCVAKADGTLSKSTYFITDDQSAEKNFTKVKVLFAGAQTDGNDFAVLEAKTRHKFPTIALGTDPTSLVGESYVNVSSPFGLGKNVFFGRTAGTLDRPIRLDDGSSWEGMTSTSISGPGPGSSGSANVCLKQRAICGIHEGNAGTMYVAVPISRFKKFLADRAKKAAEPQAKK
jgi:S1-C subfamily serine protease